MTRESTNLLQPDCYLSAEGFAREQARVFERGWHFVGLRRDLPEADDYRVVEIAGREVVLQNFAGEIAAFSNVCPHRFNALRLDRAGNGPLRCGYHAWAFGGDGLPSAVPHRGGLSLEACRTAELALDRWQVAAIGQFLFVSHRPDQDLAAEFGGLADRLLGLSALLGAEIWAYEQMIEADWKVILQNTVEFDHAFSVHRETFAPLVERPLSIIDHGVPEPHIAYRTTMRRLPPGKPIERRIAGLFDRVAPGDETGYRHHLIFPGTVFGTTDNRHVAIATYQPIAAGRTRAAYRVFAPEIPGLTPVERSLIAAAVAHDLKFIQALYDEDRAICESVQRGLRHAPKGMAGCLMPGEHLVRRFQEIYLARMQRADQP